MVESEHPDLSPEDPIARPRRDSREVLVVVAASIAMGACAALCSVSPTGSRATDAVVTFALGCFVAWLGASASWWSITAAAVVAVVGLGVGPWSVLAVVAVAVGVGIGWLPDGYRWLRSLTVGAIVVALLHVSVNPFLGASAIIAGAVMVFVAVVGLVHRTQDVRRRILWGIATTSLLTVLALVGVGIAASQASSKLQTGSDLLQDGLDQLRAGDTAAAAETLRTAADTLDDAGAQIDSFWTQPARLLPVVAQHRALATHIVAEGARSAVAAADALSAIDIDSLRLVSGSLDVEALSQLAAPLARLDTAVRQLAAALDAGDSPWLVGPVRKGLADGRDKIEGALVQTAASAAVAETGPALLGTDGARRYLVVFTAPGQARGLSGAITDYAEIRVVKGSIRQTAFGRVADLVADLARADPLHLQEPAEYFTHYGAFGAGSETEPVDPEYWTSVTMSPDTPTAASAMAQMYAAGAGHRIDGVIMMDPIGLAALVQAAGPISIPDSATLTGSLGGLVIGSQVSADALEKFLLVDQYTLADDVRLDLVEAAAGAGLRQFLAAELPDVQHLADALGSAATEGHITWWASRPAEEEAFRLVGMAGRLPPVSASDGPAVGGTDGLAVVSNDAGGNLLDAYLQRTVAYEATYNARSGRVVGDLTITLRNGVAPSGVPASVVGNALGLPIGTNRMTVSVYSPLASSAASIDGTPVATTSATELGWNVTTLPIDVAPGATSTIVLHLEGDIAPGGYSLLWRPQPLTSPDTVQLAVTNPDGSASLAFVDGTLTRTSGIDVDGVSAAR